MIKKKKMPKGIMKKAKKPGKQSYKTPPMMSTNRADATYAAMTKGAK